MISKFITEAEDRYGSLLEERCRHIFSKVRIPSHDDVHHARVWYYAKQILEALSQAEMIHNPDIAFKAIIAVWFHDTGLTVNPGPDHGSQSRIICREFLIAEHIPAEYYSDILDAVERHDDKSYMTASDPASLTSIVSVADDMDAFGNIGVLRYSEIYSMRNIPVQEMSELIIANAESRFNHLRKTYALFPALVSAHEKRLDTLISFYRQLKEETHRINQ